MAELEEKLNAILGNQEAMGQIMALARSLSGDRRGDSRPEPPGPRRAERERSRTEGREARRRTTCPSFWASWTRS